MNSEYIIYVVDTETTGLNPELHDVIEISLARFTLQNYKQIEQKTWLLKALNPNTIEEEALNVNKHLKQDILHQTQYGKDNYKEPSDVTIEIEQWMMLDEKSRIDRIFAGQNPYFDIAALQSLWRKTNSIDTFPFDVQNNNRTLDTKQLALFVDICTGQRRQFYNLKSLVKDFGAKKAKAHTASGDVQMTADLLIKITSLFSDSTLSKK